MSPRLTRCGTGALLTSRHLEFASYTTGLRIMVLLTPKHELTNICLPSKDLPGSPPPPPRLAAEIRGDRAHSGWSGYRLTNS